MFLIQGRVRQGCLLCFIFFLFIFCDFYLPSPHPSVHILPIHLCGHVFVLFFPSTHLYFYLFPLSTCMDVIFIDFPYFLFTFNKLHLSLTLTLSTSSPIHICRHVIYINFPSLSTSILLNFSHPHPYTVNTLPYPHLYAP